MKFITKKQIDIEYKGDNSLIIKGEKKASNIGREGGHQGSEGWWQGNYDYGGEPRVRHIRTRQVHPHQGGHGRSQHSEAWLACANRGYGIARG